MPNLNWGDRVSVDLITDHCTTTTITVQSNEIMMKVNPKPKLINGISSRDTVLENSKKNYAIASVTGHDYLWRAVGGQIQGDSTQAAVQVQWLGPNTNASISVSETDIRNCTYENILPVSIISIIGIDEQSNVGIGEAYPNPANQTVNFPVYTEGNETIELSLYDLTGKKIAEVFKGVLNGNQIFEYDVSKLTEGLYFYKITTSEGYQRVNRLTIMH